MSVFTNFLPKTILFANQLNTALLNILAVAQQAVATAASALNLATAAQAAAANAQNTASGAAVSASAAQATATSALTEANSAVKTVGSQHPDGSGNVNLTVASLPISAGANVAISPTGVISATGDVTSVGGISPDGAGNVALTRAAIPLTAGANVAITEDGVVSATGTVTKVLGQYPDNTGNVVITVAELPISAGANVAISPTGVISSTGGGGGGGANPTIGVLTKPAAADFTGAPINMGDATFVDSASGPILTVPIASGQRAVGVTMARSSAAGGAFTVEAVLSVTWNTQETGIGFGIVTHNAAGGGGSMYTDFWGPIHDGNGFIYDLVRFFSDGSNNSGLNSGQLRFVPSSIVRIKLVYDGSILRFYRSNNGEDNLNLLQDLSISDYPMTSAGIGVWMSLPDTATSMYPLVCQVLSFTMT